jgi:hypothetical protein
MMIGIDAFCNTPILDVFKCLFAEKFRREALFRFLGLFRTKEGIREMLEVIAGGRGGMFFKWVDGLIVQKSP